MEGRSEQHVLEALFGEAFGRPASSSFPFPGTMQSGGIIDAGLLLRFTSAAVAVMLDDITAPEMDRLLVAIGQR